MEGRDGVAEATPLQNEDLIGGSLKHFFLKLEFGATRSETQIPFGNDNKFNDNKSRFGE